MWGKVKSYTVVVLMEQCKENICANVYWICFVVRLIASSTFVLWMIDISYTPLWYWRLFSCVTGLTHCSSNGQIIRNIFRVEQGMSHLYKNCNLRRVHKIKEVLRDSTWSAVRLPERNSSPKFLNGCLYTKYGNKRLQLCRRKIFVLFKYYWMFNRFIWDWGTSNVM